MVAIARKPDAASPEGAEVYAASKPCRGHVVATRHDAHLGRMELALVEVRAGRVHRYFWVVVAEHGGCVCGFHALNSWSSPFDARDGVAERIAEFDPNGVAESRCWGRRDVGAMDRRDAKRIAFRGDWAEVVR